MEAPNEKWAGARKNADPNSAQQTPGNAHGSVANTNEPYSVPIGKPSAAILWVVHCADKWSGNVQRCRYCGKTLSLGPMFYSEGVPVYWGYLEGSLQSITGSRAPKSRFITPCYDGASFRRPRRTPIVAQFES